jgi:hypothetical protein
MKRIIAAFAAAAAAAWPTAVFAGAGVAHADDYTYYPLKADYVGSPCNGECDFFPLSTGPFPMNGPFQMNQGDVRLVTDQLAISMPDGPGHHYPEVGQGINCYDANLNNLTQGAGSGTDYRGDNTAFQWNASALLVAPSDGEYYCVISVYVNPGQYLGFDATVLSATPGQTTHGTWLEVTPFSVPGAQQWSWSPPPPPANPNCKPTLSPLCCPEGDRFVQDGTGTIATNQNAGATQCVYLGGPNPNSKTILQYTWPDMNNTAAVYASTYATVVDFSVTGQNTVCFQYTGNCRQDDDGSGDSSKITSSLSIQQQYPDGSPCGAATVVYSEDTAKGDAETDTAQTQTFDKHEGHLPVYYHATVPVSQLCNGSRNFATSLFTQLAGGDPIKFEDKNLIVVPMEEAQTTTVPTNVVGLKQDDATAAIVAAKLNPVAPENDNYVLSTAPQGTVLGTNSPGGTVEPVGSPVQLTVSTGQTTVPKVVGDIAKVAETAITDAGLTFTTSNFTNCADQRGLGTVHSQSPPAFTQVSLGASVSIEINVCTR